jgi:Uma2 family endonuclease
VPIQTRLITADEFFGMRPPPGIKQQLVRGEIEPMSFAGGEHAAVAAEIAALIRNHAKPRGLGRVFTEVGVVTETDPDTVRAPDAAFIRAERLPLIARFEKFLRIPPDLVVEVTSPGDRPTEIEAKNAEWLAFGVRLLWQVNPAGRTVTVHRPGTESTTLTAADEIDGGDVLPGFRCRVAEFFA